MKTILRLAALVLLTTAGNRLPAQFNAAHKNFHFEAGVGAGVMNGFTDLGGREGKGAPFLKDFNTVNSQPAAGIYGATHFRDLFGMELQLTAGSLKAYDSILRKKNSTGRKERNLSFQSSILEAGLKLQFYFVSCFVQMENLPRWSPYLLIGAGYFHFNPRAILDGKWMNLQPLHTEGQGFPEYPNRKNYSRWQTNWLCGSGLKFEINRFLTARFEIAYRLLHTDYLDDVSTNYIEPKLFRRHLTADLASPAYRLSDRRGEIDPMHEPSEGDKRGDPSHNDSYFTVDLKLGFTFGRKPASFR